MVDVECSHRIVIITTRFGLECDDGEPEICGDCSARWDRGEACEDWCATNQPVPELSSLAVEEQEVNFFEEAGHR